MAEPESDDHRNRSRGSETARFIRDHLLLGTAAALLLCVLILAFDVGGLRSLMAASPVGWLWLLLMVFGFWVTCCGVAMAIGIMGMGERDEG